MTKDDRDREAILVTEEMEKVGRDVMEFYKDSSLDRFEIAKLVYISMEQTKRGQYQQIPSLSD